VGTRICLSPGWFVSLLAPSAMFGSIVVPTLFIRDVPPGRLQELVEPPRPFGGI
jgi:hypothetical protein